MCWLPVDLTDAYPAIQQKMDSCPISQLVGVISVFDLFADVLGELYHLKLPTGPAAPKEFSKPGDITAGANVLLSVLLELDRASWVL